MIKTCGECTHRVAVEMDSHGHLPKAWACGQTSAFMVTRGKLIPQHTTAESATFKRVPLWCPRVDTLKSEEPQKPVDWHTEETKR